MSISPRRRALQRRAKVLSGDVGYAFRPLDVLQRESRLQLAPPPLTGIPMIAWDNFGADSAWSLIVANPGHGPAMRAARGARRRLAGAALFRRIAGADFHGVRGTRRATGWNSAPASRRCPTRRWNCMARCCSSSAASGACRWRRGRRGAVAECGRRALQEGAPRSRGKALLGATWTTAESGFLAMGEVWWDGSATADDWRRLRANAAAARALRGLPGVPDIAVAGANAASTRIFDQGNLARRGLLARLAWSEPGRQVERGGRLLARWTTAAAT
jgi:hypothetical protein